MAPHKLQEEIIKRRGNGLMAPRKLQRNIKMGGKTD